MNIGIFGITGNPPHLGHLKVLQLASKELEQVWVTPVYNHAFGKKFLDYDIRRKMIEAMLKDCIVNNVFVYDLDKQYFEKYHDTVYSYNLLVFLKEQYPEHNFKLIVGEDNFKPEVWQKFYKHQELLDEFGVIVVKDQGSHSTDIRNMLQKNEDVVQLVSPGVLKIIQENKLYQN